jgi:hypothetical protein
MTVADMHAAVASGCAKWVDRLTIMWTRTGLLVRQRPDLPGIPVVKAELPR